MPQSHQAASSSNSDSNAAEKIVQELIEASDIDENGLPEGFEDLDAVAFVKELAKRCDTRPVPRIQTSAASDASIANALLHKFEQAQTQVSEEVMETALQALQITLDDGSDGSDPLLPKLMPNGAFIIRNHHRVIAIDESPAVRIKLSNAELRAELRIQTIFH